MPGAVGIRVRPSGPVWQPGSGAGGGEGAAAQAGGHPQQIHVASSLHIPPIEVQMKDGTGGILQRVSAFLERRIDGEWPYLWLDATYLRQREGGRIVSVAAMIAVSSPSRR